MLFVCEEDGEGVVEGVGEALFAEDVGLDGLGHFGFHFSL